MTSYLIDTNHASVIMAGTPKINRILEERRARNDTFAISTTILSELYYAAYAGSRRESNLRNIQLLLNHLPVFLFDKAAAEEYGRKTNVNHIAVSTSSSPQSPIPNPQSPVPNP